MNKFWVFIVLFLAVILSSCSPALGSGAPEATNAPPDAALENKEEVAGVESEQAETEIPLPDPFLPKMECQVVSMSPTPGPTEESMFPQPQADDWVLGDENAVVTIIEYSDFQCPYCALMAADLKQLIAAHTEDIRVVFRHFPLPGHPLAKMAAYATEAAGAQGKFWEMHDIIFAAQQTFASMTEEQFKNWLVEQAGSLALDEAQFIETMDSQDVINKVDQAQEHGMNIGIPGTPFVLINGWPYQGPRDVGSLESIINLVKMEDRQFTFCPPMVIDVSKEYTATIKTEKGNVLIQLYPDKAPLTVNSFVFLAQQGWFNNITFHRVLPGFVAQSGDPSGTGMGGPGYYFKNEINDLKFDKPGMVGMANSGPDSNGSQFFFTFQATPDLDGGYTIFGEVIDGMDVLEKLSPRDPSQQMGLPPGDKILSIDIKEK